MDAVLEEESAMEKKENLVVASKVKEYIKSKEAMMASDFVDALNLEVQVLLNKAVGRCKANKRSIVAPKDL